MIYNAFLKLLWAVLVQGPLKIVSVFNDIIYYLSGGVVIDLMFGSSKSFSFDKVPRAFFIFLSIAIVFFAIMYITQLIIIQFKKSSETKSKILKCLESSALATLFIFLIPIGFYLLNIAITTLTSAIVGSFGQKNNISYYIYHSGNPNWNGDISGTPSNFSAPDNIRDWNIFSSIIGALFMTFICFIIGMTLIKKIIELFFLFVISPIIMAMMTVDEGRAANLWKDMVISKFFATTATLTGFFIYIAALQVIAKANLSGLSNSNFVKQFFILIFNMGGGMATLQFTSIIEQFIGEKSGAGSSNSGPSLKSIGSKLANPYTSAYKHLSGKSSFSKGLTKNVNTGWRMANGGVGLRSLSNSIDRRVGIPGLNKTSNNFAKKSTKSLKLTIQQKTKRKI